MKALKNIFNFYLNASIHVALATTALVQMTLYFCHLPFDKMVTALVFFGTICTYNFMKYTSVVLKNKTFGTKIKVIIVLSVLSFLITVFCFFNLRWHAELTTLIFGILCILYVIPIAKEKNNLRNLAGIKIYIVSFCWAGITTLIPIINANLPIETDIIYKFSQRFILTLILILIFEINDLKYDDIRLKTVPQTIGIKNTKHFIYTLLIPFYFLEFFKNDYYPNQWLINLILVGVIFLFTYFASANRSKYYTLFWVESVPILWYLLIVLFMYF